jgi:protein-L-isoaspartate O-methyltransferase
MPSSLMQQLTLDRNLITPVIEHGSRYLAVFEKEEQTFSRKVLCQVLYL